MLAMRQQNLAGRDVVSSRETSACGPRRPRPDDGQEATQAPRPVGGVHRGLLSCTGRGLGPQPDLPERTACRAETQDQGPCPIQGALGEKGPVHLGSESCKNRLQRV